MRLVHCQSTSDYIVNDMSCNLVEFETCKHFRRQTPSYCEKLFGTVVILGKYVSRIPFMYFDMNILLAFVEIFSEEVVSKHSCVLFESSEVE